MTSLQRNHAERPKARPDLSNCKQGIANIFPGIESLSKFVGIVVTKSANPEDDRMYGCELLEEIGMGDGEIFLFPKPRGKDIGKVYRTERTDLEKLNK